MQAACAGVGGREGVAAKKRHQGLITSCACPKVCLRAEFQAVPGDEYNFCVSGCPGGCVGGVRQ
jgi:hypothetical protein